jgi:hypothetical protein
MAGALCPLPGSPLSVAFGALLSVASGALCPSVASGAFRPGLRSPSGGLQSPYPGPPEPSAPGPVDSRRPSASRSATLPHRGTRRVTGQFSVTGAIQRDRSGQWGGAVRRGRGGSAWPGRFSMAGVVQRDRSGSSVIGAVQRVPGDDGSGEGRTDRRRADGTAGTNQDGSGEGTTGWRWAGRVGLGSGWGWLVPSSSPGPP